MLIPAPLQAALLFTSAFVAGAVNSVAGGGTLLTFPALLSIGISPIVANATSTIALVPGSAGAFWGYRTELRGDARTLLALAIPSVLGGVVGAVLTFAAGDKLFARLVPWLILGATVLFIAQEPISRWLAARAGKSATEPALDAPQPVRLWAVMFFQFIVALYGGFFGAGIGILMLAALGLAGLTNVHRMNGLKNFAAVCINGAAAVTFIANGKVEWPIAAMMATGAVLGGYLGAGIARRIGQKNVRRAIVLIGVTIATVMFARQIRR